MTQAPAVQNNEKTLTEQKLDDLERFIARRFDEISMEIEATSQLMEMAEEDAGKRFQDMLSMLHSVSSIGDGTSSANSGTQLEAVVHETEIAATTIMDAAENIKSVLEKNEDLLSDDMRLASLSESIFNDAQNIVLACGFQDLVSQRVRTSLKNIRDIEERLGSTLSKFGIDVSKPALNSHNNAPLSQPEQTQASQTDIDALFD